MGAKRRHPPKPQVLLLELLATLGRVRVRERFIKGETEGEIVYGQQLGDLIEINPVPGAVETVIHECLHALKPEWSERTVRQQTSRLFNRLSEAEMRAIYRIYRERLG